MLLVASCSPTLNELDAYPLPPATQALATLMARGIATTDRTEYPPPIPAPLAPIPTLAPTADANPYPLEINDPSADIPAAVQTARAFLAGSLSMPVRGVRLISWEQANWITPNLGCQPAGAIDLQNPTPGYLVMLHAGDQFYELHSDLNGEELCLAEPLQPGERIPLARNQTSQEAAELARSHLASRLGLPIDEINIMNLVRAEWEDDSLRCPQFPGVQPDRANPQPILGYRITLDTRETQHEYHSGGFWLVYCGVIK